MNYFESEVAESAKLLGIVYEKLAVPHKLSYGAGGRPYLQPLKKEPYDAFLVHDGIHHAIEMKSQDLFGSFNLGKVEANQIEGLNREMGAGCPAYLLINFRKIREGRKTKEHLQAFALPWWKWINLEIACRLYDRGSIPKEWFLDPAWFIPIPRVHVEQPDGTRVPVWQLRVLLRTKLVEPTAHLTAPGENHECNPREPAAYSAAVDGQAGR